MFSIGLVFMAVAATTYFFGPSQQPVRLPEFLRGQVRVLGLDLGAYRLFLIAVVAVLTVALHLLLVRTRFGAQVRASVDNAVASAGLGINVNRVFGVTFALGSGLAGLGGGLGVDVLGLDPTFPLKYMVYFLLVVAIGGAGTIKGGLVAAMILGICDVAGKYYVPQIGSFIIYFLMVTLMIAVPRRAVRAARMSAPVAAVHPGDRSAAADRPLARDRDRVLARRARGVLRLPEPPRARQPDPDHRALRRVARPDPRLRGHRLARPRGVLRHRRVRGRPARRARLGRAVLRARRRRRRRRGRRLRDELPRRARVGPRAAHGDARHRPHAVRGGEPAAVDHRRRRRSFRRDDGEGLRPVLVRPDRQHRLSLQPWRPVPAVRRRPPDRELAVRPVAARRPRERAADAGDRRAGHEAADRDLHGQRGDGGRRRRPPRADDAVRRPRRVRLPALGRPDDHAGAGRRRAPLRRARRRQRCS